ncbi:MAG: hypothetical protein ACI89U_000591 [Gammaproteobacteria bacterium]
MPVVKAKENRKQQLNQVIALSRQQLDAVKNEEWEQAELLETQRQQLLKACFEQPIAEEFVNLARLGIDKLRELEKQILEIVEPAKEETASKLRELNNANKANSAYRQQQKNR